MVKLNKKEIKAFYDSLIEQKLISKEDILFDDDEEFNFNINEISEIASKGAKLRVNPDDGSLQYDNEGKWEEVPSMKDGIENVSIFLADRIPGFTFKTSEEFTDFKNSEIENIYICSLLAGILGEDFEEQFKEVVENYSFIDVEEGVDNCTSFTQLLGEWQEFQSKTIQAIISACRQNISEKKEEYSSLNLSLLDREERLKLESLKIEVTNYFNNYKRDHLKEENIKSLKKHEIFKLYDDRDTHIKDLIINSPEYKSVKTLYFIDKLNSEDINVFKKKKISNIAKSKAVELFSERKVSENIFREYVNKFNRKGLKVYLRRWKNQELEKYLSNRESYLLPKKV